MIFRELKRAAQILIPWWDVWKVRDRFLLLFQIHNVITISMKLELENVSMSQKALRMLLKISDNFNPAARVAWGQPSILR